MLGAFGVVAVWELGLGRPGGRASPHGLDLGERLWSPQERDGAAETLLGAGPRGRQERAGDP